MEKERCLKGSLRENKNKRHPELDSGSHLVAVLESGEIPYQVRNDKFIFNIKAFTLIELLVVVLIIGILAALALSQYQKAVWKSRNTQLKTIASSVAQAMEAYYMANGVWPTNFDELDLDLPLQAGTKTCGYTTLGTDSVRKGKNFEILLTGNSSLLTNITAVWTEGPYQCDGFIWTSSDKRILCREYPDGNYNFCGPIERCVQQIESPGSVLYELP